jgi:hypothetical protein
MEFEYFNINFRPLHQLKYAYNHQLIPVIEEIQIVDTLVIDTVIVEIFKTEQDTVQKPQYSNGLESKFNVLGKSASALLGNVRVKVDHSYRKVWSTVKSEIKNKYKFDFSTIRKFGKKYRLNLMMSHQWELARDVFNYPDSTVKTPRPDDYKLGFKIDLQAALFVNLAVGGSFSYIEQVITEDSVVKDLMGNNLSTVQLVDRTVIRKYGLTLDAEIPKINLPIKSFLLAEERSFAGVNQTQFSMETKANYRIRKISLILRHVMKKENQRTEKYSVHEIYGKISRQFDIM